MPPEEPQIVGEELAAPVTLGGGRSIRPPKGWTVHGFVTDNPLWILPKSRVRWSPPENERLNLHWSLTPTPVDAATVKALVALLAAEDEVSEESLQALSGKLITIDLGAIKKASVVKDHAGAMLRIDYRYQDGVEAGVVLYSPTEMYEYGEVQILGYEGEEPLYSQYLSIGERALSTFTIGIKAATPAKLMPAPHVMTASGRHVPLQTYSLKAGETISSVVKSRWPSLDDNERTIKVRQVFAYNRSAGNSIEAWNLKEGTVIFLPPQ